MKREKMRQFIGAVLSVVFGVCCLCLPGAAQTSLTPSWLKWLGNGTNNWSCTSGTCKLTDELWFASFNLSAGATLVNAGGNGPLIIRATGDCTINGTIIANGNAIGGGITGDGDFGGGGGGGGGGAAAGVIGKTTEVIQGIPLIKGGLGGSAGGGNGYNGTTPYKTQYQGFLSNGSSWPGGGGMGGNGGSNGGVGGQGGMPVIFVCNTIEFTGTIDVSGASGANAPGDNKGAGGGGGAGYVVFAAVTYTSNTGNINVSGGAGGSCGSYTNCGAGGQGGDGWSSFITIQ
jgi:hypothetical protein